MTKEESMQRAAEELRAEICLLAGIPENNVRSLQVKGSSRAPHWTVVVQRHDGGPTIRINMIEPLAQRLASPLAPSPPGAAHPIPEELTRRARIEPGLRYLGVYGFGIPTQREDLLKEWLYERKARITLHSSDADEGCKRNESLDPYHPGEIIRCAGLLASVLCQESGEAGFPDRWADFRGENFRRNDAVAYGEKWHRLSNWDFANVPFEKFLSTACIGSEKWMTFGQITNRWYGLKTSLLAPAATYSAVDQREAERLLIRPVAACQCPTCGGKELVRPDNTCGGCADGHVPHIRAYIRLPDGRSRDERMFRLVNEAQWSPRLTWKCNGCGRFFFLRDSELRRQRATVVLKVLDEQVSIKDAATESPAITRREIMEFKAAMSKCSEAEWTQVRIQLEKESQVAAYACPNCKQIGDWSEGATFWSRIRDQVERDGAERYVGFKQAPDWQQDQESNAPAIYDRSSGSEAEPEQVIQRAREQEAVRILCQRVPPGSTEELIVRCYYQPPLDVQQRRDVQQQLDSLPPEERNRAIKQLKRWFLEIEAELDSGNWGSIVDDR